MNIYDILEIEPTDDFRILRRAFFKKALETHPDKVHPDDCANAIEQFKVLINAYELVNTAEKLIEYFCSYQQRAQEEVLRQNDFKSEEDTGPDNGLRAANIGDINVFIPVPTTYIWDLNENWSDTVGRENVSEADKKEFVKNFSFSKLATAANREYGQGLIQVGITYEEAMDIVNQHSHHCKYFIIEVLVPFTKLSDVRRSEADLFRNQLNASSVKFLLLNLETRLRAEDIVSMRPMRRYENSCRWRAPRDHYFPWSEMSTVHNDPSDQPALSTAGSNSLVQFSVFNDAADVIAGGGAAAAAAAAPAEKPQSCASNPVSQLDKWTFVARECTRAFNTFTQWRHSLSLEAQLLTRCINNRIMVNLKKAFTLSTTEFPSPYQCQAIVEDFNQAISEMNQNNMEKGEQPLKILRDIIQEYLIDLTNDKTNTFIANCSSLIQKIIDWFGQLNHPTKKEEVIGIQSDCTLLNTFLQENILNQYPTYLNCNQIIEMCSQLINRIKGINGTWAHFHFLSKEMKNYNTFMKTIPKAEGPLPNTEPTYTLAENVGGGGAAAKPSNTY